MPQGLSDPQGYVFQKLLISLFVHSEIKERTSWFESKIKFSWFVAPLKSLFIVYSSVFLQLATKLVKHPMKEKKVLRGTGVAIFRLSVMKDIHIDILL